MIVEKMEKYDTAFLGILQNEGTIVNFLDAVFSFLYRKTDFYHELNDQKTMGFLPGVSERLAFNAFKAYQKKAKEDKEKIEAKRKKTNPAEPVSPVAKVEEVEISTKEPEKPCEAAASKCEPKEVPKQECTLSTSKNQSEEVTEKQDSPSNESRSTTDKESSEEQDPDDDPELTRQQRQFQANADSYNGAIREKYVWGQDINEVNVRVLIPQHIKKGKECKVIIQRKHLKVEVKDADSSSDSWKVVIDGDLTWDINKEECVWLLVHDQPRPDQPKQYNILITLAKIQERWWDALLTDEPKISIRKIDPSRPMTDLDDESQAKLEEMMWNERQKRLGLPSSSQLKMESMLRTAWDAEGSPFKGQPFDISKINVSNDGQNNINFNQ